MSVMFSKHCTMYPSFRYVKKMIESNPPSSLLFFFLLNSKRSVLKFCAFIMFCPFLLVFLKMFIYLFFIFKIN